MSGTNADTPQALDLALAYCPGCGRPACGGPARPFSCPACGYTLFANVAAAVCAWIQDDAGRLLATVRRNEPAAGALDLPGGFVDPQETAEQALARELAEELGLELVEARYMASAPNRYPYRGIVYRTLDLVFACTVNGLETMRCADDVAGIVWVDPETVDVNRFGLESIRQLVKRLRDGARP